ncbi:hypothetical protein [Ramlibacter sp. PS4R-6]|uniref:hypothetical protein n=1 Tax=Ramlibacter sp. PS4R-6 TaxID=3133438 RepID=UPI0030A458CC
MKLHCLAAAFAAASSLFLAGCATEAQQGRSAEAASDPCLNVRPATGTALVRKEDCGVRPQQSVGPSAQQPQSPKRQ